MTADGARALAERLRHPRYEVLPLEGIERAVLAHVPKEATVTVTASPRRGLHATIEVSEHLARQGYAVVPHLSARLIHDGAHLEQVLARLRAAGVRELFVPAGDAPEPAGEFSSAAALLAAMAELRADFPAIGITGYPESHHLISDDVTISAMFEKAEMATYIVSQICFDADVTAGWISDVRARGTGLPIWIGVPGVVDHAKLLRISMRIGLGESARFLRAQHGWVRRLMTRRFKPDGLLRDLAPIAADPCANVAGFHFYTFNELARMERWRRRTIERLTG
ncbi:MAG: methylenetetrahydrofolate reductase [Anaeromyxobacteraceae bacterium]